MCRFVFQVKIGIVKSLDIWGSISAELKFPILLVAASDSHYAVAEAAENAIRLANE